MSCPIILANVASPSATVTISDLSELLLNIGDSVNIEGQFSLEEISNSSDLQAAITAGEVTLTFGSGVITDLSDLCITHSELELLDKDRWIWEAGRKGNINVSAIDLIRLDSSATSDTPFIALKDCSINLVAARSQTDLDWNFQIIKSVNNGTNWSVVRAETVDTQTKVFDYVAGTNTIPLAQGDLIRLRFVKISSSIQYPQVTLLVKEG